MRILLFHNWSSLGFAVAHTLMREKTDGLMLVGAASKHPDIALLEEAARMGVPCGMVEDVDGEAFARDMKELDPDVAIVATFPKRLPVAVLGRLPRGAYNVHPSLLPAYRGPSPEFWALRNGDTETGVSIHVLAERFDAGGIVAQALVPIAERETSASLDEKLGDAAVKLIKDFVRRLRTGETISPQAQDEARVTHAPLPRPKDLVVQWKDGARSIERLVRACGPSMLATAKILGESVGLVRVQLGDPSSKLRPGELHFDGDSGALLCGTNRGALVLDDVEIAGVPLDGEELATRLGISRRSNLN